MTYVDTYDDIYTGATGLPTITVEVAFATDPADTPTWVPVGPAEGFSLRRGRSQEGDKFLAGRATIVLANEDRRFDPAYAASPYHPNVVPMRRVRIRAEWDGVTYDVFSGYADGWEQTYDYPEVAHCVLSATDAFKVLANIELPGSVYAADVLADSPSHWWRLGEPSGATVALDSMGTAHAAQVGTAPTFGVAGLTVRDSDTAVTFPVGVPSTLVAPAAFPSGSGAFTIEMIVNTPALTNLFRVPDMSVYGLIDGSNIVGFACGAQGVSSTTTVPDGTTTHLVFTRDAAGTLRIFIDGVDRTNFADVDTTSITTSDFVIGAWETPGGGSGQTMDEVALYNYALDATRIAAHSSARAVAWAGETSGARITRILDAAGWPAADRDIDTGMAVLAGADLGGNTLAALQKVEETEQGRLFITADGKVRFISRDNLLRAPYNASRATYGDSGSELEYEDLSYRYDDQTIYNEAVVSRAGGTVVTVRDATSIARYLRRSKVFDGLLHLSDATSVDLANWVVAHYKDPLLRVTDLTLHPAAGDNAASHFPEVLGTELAERVTVRRTPQCLGAAIDQAVHVEGIEHQVSAVDWTTKWNLSPAEVAAYWILGVAGSSELGQTTRVGF